MGGLTTFASLMNKVKNHQDRVYYKRKYRTISTSSQRKIKFPKVSDEELEIIKTKIRARAKKQQMINNVAIFIMCLIVFYLLFEFL
ncbi:hypothetical protein [Urechidicola vernalis]|uniref:Uncharacterized protein n=1 Tax=Urechidicola vernalis TaxID=3075600 RepID=A0ABU2Y4B1_9FLAO|nr:hypothetical protein [Urechidicola sp. P050]MDT0551893.1 hypothetical protein [Urechidicola sp. P050]